MTYAKNLLLLSAIAILSTPLRAAPTEDAKRIEDHKEEVEAVSETNKNNPQAEAHKLIEEAIARGDQAAMALKVEGLYEGRFGYTKNPAEAKTLNDTLAATDKHEALWSKVHEAIWRKVDGLALGKNGYEKNPADARALVNEQVKKGDAKAIHYKWVGLLGGGHHPVKKNVATNDDSFISPGNVFEENPGEAKAFINTLVDQKNAHAIRLKVLSLSEGDMGFEKNPEEAKALIEQSIAEGNTELIWSKIDGLVNGVFGYRKNPAEARDLIESLVAQGDKQAIRVKAEALTRESKNYGYEKNPEEARALIESLITQGDKLAILAKVEGLAKGANANDEGHWEGSIAFEKNPEAAKAFIDALVDQKNNYGLMIKVVGLIQGKYGYKKDPEAGYALAKKELIANFDENGLSNVENVGPIHHFKWFPQSFLNPYGWLKKNLAMNDF